MASDAKTANNAHDPSGFMALRLTVHNHPGVMSHVCGLFARRAFNVEGILVTPQPGPDGRGTTSRIWLVVNADARLGQGLIALGRGQASVAARLLQAASSGPDLLASPKELFLALGDAKALAGDTAGALAAWAEVRQRTSRLLGDAPRDELAQLKSARLLETRGEGGKALAIFSSLAGASGSSGSWWA